MLLAASCTGGRHQSEPSARACRRRRTPARFRSSASPTDSGIDYLDPGLTYSPEGSSVLWNVYLPLLGYRHVTGPGGATIVPYLARELPQHLGGRNDVHARAPAGPEVLGRDAGARKRLQGDHRARLPSRLAGGRVLLEHRRRRRLRPDEEGADHRDLHATTRPGEITIHLAAPQADFENVLASEFAALVPARAPATDTSLHPLPATGPYVIKSYKPNDKIVEARNPYFDRRRVRRQRSGRESGFGRLGRRGR